MISQIQGSVLEKSTHSVVVDVHGIGYELEVPVSTAFDLPDAGQVVTLYTHFVVREDAQLLFGFNKRIDRDTFRVLIKVNGVGPKLGVAILSGLDSHALAACVESDDVTALVKLPGIGKKTAERLLIELRDKLNHLFSGSESSNASSLGESASSSVDVKDEAAAALVSLGYKPGDAEKLVKKVFVAGASLEELIKEALKAV